MTARHLVVAGSVVLLACAVAACRGGRSTDDTPIATTTPAGQSAAPPADDVRRRDNALIRVVDAVPAVAPLDVYADDQRVFERVDFTTVTPYRELHGARFEFAVRPAGAAPAEPPLASHSEGLDDGDHYTVMAVPGDTDAAALLVMEDDQSRPPAGKARLRVVHAARDVGGIDVVMAGRKDPLVDDVNFKTVSSYTDIDPVSGSVTVRPDGASTVLLTVRDVHFDAGKSYTMVVVGCSTAAPRLDAILIQDEASGPAATLP